MTNFPHKVISTYKVLMKKAFNEDIDEAWIDWAIEMIQAGYESDNLYILAGVTRPYHQFELQRLTDKVLAEMFSPYIWEKSGLGALMNMLLSKDIYGSDLNYYLFNTMLKANSVDICQKNQKLETIQKK